MANRENGWRAYQGLKHAYDVSGNRNMECHDVLEECMNYINTTYGEGKFRAGDLPARAGLTYNIVAFTNFVQQAVSANLHALLSAKLWAEFKRVVIVKLNANGHTITMPRGAAGGRRINKSRRVNGRNKRRSYRY